MSFTCERSGSLLPLANLDCILGDKPAVIKQALFLVAQDVAAKVEDGRKEGRRIPEEELKGLPKRIAENEYVD